MKKQLFKKATTRLTLMYLMVLMAVSLLFSVSLHRVLAIEIDRNYERSIEFANRMPGFRLSPLERQDFITERLEDRKQSRDNLLGQLFVVNIAVLGAGGILCLYLARRTMRPIEAAHASLERFTSDASHELRTPLTAMQTEIEVALLNDKLSAKEAKELLESNLEEVQRLTHLSERLLLLARLDEESLPMTDVSLANVLQKAVSVVEPLAQTKKIKVELETTKDLQVHADQSSLTELFVILFDNAIKYSPEKTVVTVRTKKTGKQLVVSVTDQGMGIAEADLTKIFDRFYRADTSRTGGSAHGYGLGLSLAQKIAQLHGTTIQVKSKLNKGSTFSIVFENA